LRLPMCMQRQWVRRELECMEVGMRKRSVSPDIPIIVILDNDELIIQSSSLRSDITIRIMDSSTMVYEETVLAEKTGYILIDLKDNKSGVYTLNLTNQWGDHLYGEFTLE
jgi:hypothetical protein